MTPKSMLKRLNQDGNFFLKFAIFSAGIFYVAKFVFPLEISDFNERMTLMLDGVGTETHYGVQALKRNYCDRDKHNACQCVALLPGLADRAITYREILKLSESEWKNENVKLYAIDLPGEGGSKAPDSPDGYAISALAESVTKFLSGTDCKKFIIVGHSFGARVAAEMVYRSPEKYDMMILVAPATGSESNASETEAFFNHPTAQGLRTFLSQAYATQKKTYSNELLEAAAKRIANSSAKAVIAMNKTAPSLEAILPQIRQTSFILWGEDDRITDPSQAKLLAAKLVNSRLYLEPNCGHLMQKECPDMLRAAIASLATTTPGSLPELKR